jgi:hypothetical protein
MQQCHREIVILKPTSVFLAFLAAQAPDADLPPLEILQTDTTAYTILRQDGEEETLDEIERHFSTMFRYEIRRWLGDEATNPIEGSFLDFLCCFKFEMHSQIVLMETSVEKGRQLLCIKPRSVLLKWIKSTAEEQQEDFGDVLERVTLTQLSENATVVVKNFKQKADIQNVVEHQFHSIFKAEMLRMCDKTGLWPDVETFEQFNQYFAIEIHTQLVHLS